jgi:DNA-binding NarL/FixJ family response regulator
MTPRCSQRAGSTDVSALANLLFTGAWRVLSTTIDADSVSYVVGRTASAPRRGAALSRRERAVLVLACHGHANKHIAATLSLSTSTVSTLLRRARDKLSGRVPAQLLGALCRELPGTLAPTFVESGRARASEPGG